MLAEGAQIGLAANDANNYRKFFSKAVWYKPIIGLRKPVCNFKCSTAQKDIPCDTYHLDIVCTSLDKYTNPHVLVQTTIHQTPEAGQQ